MRRAILQDQASTVSTSSLWKGNTRDRSTRESRPGDRIGWLRTQGWRITEPSPGTGVEADVFPFRDREESKAPPCTTSVSAGASPPRSGEPPKLPSGFPPWPRGWQEYSPSRWLRAAGSLPSGSEEAARHEPPGGDPPDPRD